MNDHDATDYLRLLDATDAIAAIGLSQNGPLPHLLQAVLDRVLAAIGLPDGGLYLLGAQSRALILVAALPKDGAVAAQGARIPLDEHPQSLPVRTATNAQ